MNARQVYLDCRCVRWVTFHRWMLGEEFYCPRHRRVSVVIVMIEPQHRYQTVTSLNGAHDDTMLF